MKKTTTPKNDLNLQLVQAAKDKNVDLVTRLLAQGADANFKKYEEGTWGAHNQVYPIHEALSGEPSIEIVRLLLEAGAKVTSVASHSNWKYD
jgi:ankyrin repeat protein